MNLKRFLPFLPVLFLACGQEEITVPAAEAVQESDTLFVNVPEGTFINSVGDTVTVEAFSMMRSEVSNRLYRHLADNLNLAHPPDPGFPGMEDYFYNYPDYPVVNVSPFRARKAASSMGCSLPTTDQWEYAASLGLTGEIAGNFPWGILSPPDVPGVPANYMALDSWNDRDADGYLYTAPSGEYPLSEGGFQDLAGNVSEMALCYADSTIRLLGGSWAQPEDAMRFGYSRIIADGDIAWHAGFRFVK
ncbi:hypothetical protein CSA37_00175 [Candidatus Fermentibacteria bacterium]|nr:MAG: hypothetical protein CSA37_00175 [Candidatus Fermentibacteria bacterium]